MYIFILGLHLGFGNCGGLGRGKICKGSGCEVGKLGKGERRENISSSPTSPTSTPPSILPLHPISSVKRHFVFEKFSTKLFIKFAYNISSSYSIATDIKLSIIKCKPSLILLNQPTNLFRQALDTSLHQFESPKCRRYHTQSNM